MRAAIARPKRTTKIWLLTWNLRKFRWMMTAALFGLVRPFKRGVPGGRGRRVGRQKPCVPPSLVDNLTCLDDDDPLSAINPGWRVCVRKGTKRT